MRFQSIDIANLRAVRSFRATDLSDFIVIAGQNGSGKSCVFDAIRLLKSVYGGYSSDEHMQWFTEFAINPGDQRALRGMFRDPETPISIRARVEFAADEVAFIAENSTDLLWPIAWQRVTGQRMDHWSFNRVTIATQMEHFGPLVDQQLQQLKTVLDRSLLEGPAYELGAEILPDGSIDIVPCPPASVSFQAFRPLDLGIIEYHSASRAYTRQPLQGINLDARAFEDQRRQQSLYNAQTKYQNVKTELAAGYLRNLIGKESGLAPLGEDLNETLKELFSTFFPDKEYLGVRPLPGGSLEFPVRLPGGEVHDIDDLSSGEKEILYGYLRLRNSTPRRSVILLDEPELHLNPSLLQGFTDFYHRHLGQAQDNQLWLVTHSDTLLRQAIGNSQFRVYHMLGAGLAATENQASEILLEDDLERALVDLVGDLAAYRPHAKVVILEGNQADGFDEALIRRLFPDFAKRVNLVSAGSKQRVGGLYALLNRAVSQSGMQNRFFAIVDRDHESSTEPTPGAREFSWDVYHIENYLLEPAAIRQACVTLTGQDAFRSDAAVETALKEQAEAIVDSLVLEKVQAEVNREIVRAIRIGGNPSASDVALELRPSIEGSLSRVQEMADLYSVEKLELLATTFRTEFEKSFESEAWQKDIPGRRILAGFARQHVPKASYEILRNAILDRLAQTERRPAFVESVLDAVLEA